MARPRRCRLSFALIVIAALSFAPSCKDKTPTTPTPTPPPTSGPPPTPPPTTGSVSGTVTDSATGATLSGATVAAGGRSTTTAADGRYSITDLAVGPVTVTSQRQGQRNFSQSVTITAGATATANIAMTPAIVAGFQGTWTGSWSNTTFGSLGSATMSLSADTPAQAVRITFDMTGDVFGNGDPPAETQTIPYTTSGGTFTGTSSFYGSVTFTATATGQLTGTVTNIPGGAISRVDITGMVTPQTLVGSAVIRFANGATANGTMNLSKQSGPSTTAVVAQSLLARLHSLVVLSNVWRLSGN